MGFCIAASSLNKTELMTLGKIGKIDKCKAAYLLSTLILMEESQDTFSKSSKVDRQLSNHSKLSVCLIILKNGWHFLADREINRLSEAIRPIKY